MSAAPTMTTEQIDLHDLSELMRSVNQVTLQLKETHVSLQQQVARLQGELREANAQLRRSRSLAALGEMAAGIAHEVRNPLASIQLYAQMLGEDLAERPEQRRVCDKIARSVERLDGIVNDVLAFARDTCVRAQPIAAAEFLESVVNGCEALLHHGGVAVEARVRPTGLSLEADPGLLAQAMANLVRNAVEAMAEMPESRRRLTITAHRQTRRASDGTSRPRVVFAIEDAGPGIPEEVISRMFNPFFTTRATGTGLGLAIVHRIVDAHGGETWVSNRPEGGARVEIRIPPAPVSVNGMNGFESQRQTDHDGVSLNGAVRRRIAVENNR